MWSSAVGLHIDDHDLICLNYLHFGAPKIWYIIHPSSYGKLEELVNELKLFSEIASLCLSPMQHKSLLIKPSFLEQHSIGFYRIEQKLNELVLIFPGTYHFYFDTGFNLSETVKYALPSLLAFQRRSPRLCSCSLSSSLTVSLNRRFFTDDILGKFRNEHLSPTSSTCIDLCIGSWIGSESIARSHPFYSDEDQADTHEPPSMSINQTDFSSKPQPTIIDNNTTLDLLLEPAYAWFSSMTSDTPLSTDFFSSLDQSNDQDSIWTIFEQLSTPCYSESIRTDDEIRSNRFQPYPAIGSSTSRRRLKRRKCYKCRRYGHLRKECPHSSDT